MSQDKSYQYSIQEVQQIATAVGRTSSDINNIIEGVNRTKSRGVAQMVSALTGKPAELYLVSKAVKIEQVEIPSGYEPTRYEAETDLRDISDLDLLQLMREVQELSARIGIEMQRRIVL